MGFVDSFNLYAFNAFDSVNFFDPMGLESKGMAEAPIEKPFNWIDDGTKKAKAPNALDDANTLLCARGVNCRDREDPRTPADPGQRLASAHPVEAVVVGLGGFAKGVTIGLGIGMAAAASPTLAAALIVGGSALLAFQFATGGVDQLSAAVTQAAVRLAEGKVTLDDVESFTTGVGLLAGTAGAGASAELAGANRARAALVKDARLHLVAPSPRVELASRFRLQRGKNVIRLTYGDVDYHGLEVAVDSRGVGFDIRSSGDQALPSGTDMILGALNRLNQEGVEVNALRGVWIEGTDSVNAVQFAEGLSRGLSPVDAAVQTWSGRLFGRLGFVPSSVEVGSTTRVTFERIR
jgi:hypothetical protein